MDIFDYLLVQYYFIGDFLFYKNFLKKDSKIGEIAMRMKNIFSVLVVCVCISVVSGCVFVLAGGAGLVGGYIISKDTIQGEYDVSFSDAWDAAVEVSQMLGTTDVRDSTSGLVDSMIDNAKVRIEVTQLTKEAVRVRVKARKGIFPRLPTAEKVFVKIVQQLM